MSTTVRISLLLLLFLTALTAPSFSLFEDQVGLTDWHRQYIGKVKDAVFHTQKTGRKRVFVSTEANVVASLDLRHGEIFWRHFLGSNDFIDGIDVAMGKYVITLSSGGSILRAWNLPDGQMAWESHLEGPSQSKALLLVTAMSKVEKDNVLLVVARGSLHAVSGLHGDILWKHDFPSESFQIQPLGSDLITVVGFTSLSQFDVYRIKANTGELLKHASATIPGGLSREVSLVTSDTLVMLDSSATTLLVINFLDGNIVHQKTFLSDLIKDFSGTAAIVPSKLTGIIAVRTSIALIFIRLTRESKLEVVGKVSHNTAFSDALSFSDSDQAFALVQHGGNGIDLAIKHSHNWGSHLLQETIKIDHHRGSVHKVFVNNYICTDRSQGFRALIVMEDHSLLLLQQGETVWSREEGLASIVDVTTSELPVEKKGVSVAKVEQSLFEWLQIQQRLMPLKRN